jgi:NAD(P)-dependent dehydrogenase (short-subunit alcohol dehydrogenase family)
MTNAHNPKTVLITGAGTGFGHDTALTLARAGHKVFASMRDPAGRNKAHADALLAAGVKVVELDVTSDASVAKAVKAVLDQGGRIDVLVNNAGIASAGVTEAFTPDQARAVFDVNVFGLLRTTREVLPAMRENKAGLVINIGSILGRVTFPFFSIYGASKFAVEALSDGLRYEVSQFGVEVVLVQPSAYPTPMYAGVQQPADAQRVASYGPVGEIPGKMFGTFMEMFKGENGPNPHDVAEAVARIVSLEKGARPTRVVVGTAFGADTINDSTAPVQAQVLQGLGLGALDKLA